MTNPWKLISSCNNISLYKNEDTGEEDVIDCYESEE